MPYVGIVKDFDFLHATNEVLTERGVPLPLPGQSTTTPETRREKGLVVQTADHRQGCGGAALRFRARGYSVLGTIRDTAKGAGLLGQYPAWE
ncbi:hypothetical protein [Acidocella aromatica]|uniref:Uncharacterized protein n=1 Tax=Acidocella aromatica TaxID=1303579 RepID=A0A840VBF2_9PROT|nr:hypothetical protein [Acidocella aromatica]MBB5373103.1 hypothetical protein [Acidocella aromatica]